MTPRGALAELLAGRPLPAEPPGLLDWLRSRRLAAELAALPGIAGAGLSSPTLRGLAIERARVRAAAETRAPVLQRAGRALADAGIPAWLYKGEAFIRLTHGDPSRRPMADLDLVVLRGARDRACAALVAAGFRETPHATALHDVLVDERARGPGYPHGVAVELHGDTFPPPHPFELDLKGVLARSRPSEVPGLRLPSPEDALVLHAFHLLFFEQDATKGQASLRDIALVAPHCRPAELQARADATGLAAVVEALLARAEDQASSPPPDPMTMRVDELLRRARQGPRTEFPRLRPRHELSRRRRLAFDLTMRELDASLASAELEPPQRVLSRRLVAALWQPRLGDCLRLLVRGLRGSGGAWGRARRYAGAVGGGER